MLLPLLIGIGCTAAPLPQPTPSPSLAELTAKEIKIKVISGDNSEAELQKGGTVNINVNDRIQLDDSGQGEVRFQDRLRFEMLRKTEVRVDDAVQESSGSTFVRLHQSYGNVHVRLEENALAWVTLETDYATITTLEKNTDFIICHKPEEITCGVVLEGAVEFDAQGIKKIAKKGEAIYVKPGQPPSSPICAHEDEVKDWLDKMHGTEKVIGLGKMVAGWPQEPCGAKPLPASEGMVIVEAGLYEVGTAETDEFHAAVQNVPLKKYWIDQYEVTNAQYQKFLDETNHQPPLNWPGEANHPVKGVTWDDAAAYCTWAHKRLPAEAEWEVAARGPGPNPPIYPWGSDPMAGGQVNDLPRTDTYEVGTVPYNKSPFGVYDMAGNVWEWVGEPYANLAEGLKILRGGRHGLIKDMAYRQQAESNNERFVPYAGFRCAADQVEGE